jgi:hypothetical protein
MAICPLSSPSRPVKACKGKILQKTLSPSSFDIAVSSCNGPVCVLPVFLRGVGAALRGGHGGELSDATPVAES